MQKSTNDTITATLSESTGMRPSHVQAVLDLLAEGATIPFIARYRKEVTGGATDEQLRVFAAEHARLARLETRKSEVCRLIEERATLDDALRARIASATTISQVEDLYRPYKEKRSTRAGVALAAGLEPVAELLIRAECSPAKLRGEAERFAGVEGFPDVDAVVGGAKDIVAERLSDDPDERERARNYVRRFGSLVVSGKKGLEKGSVFARYDGHREPVSRVASHRYLAIMRGVREKQLSAKIALDYQRMMGGIRSRWEARSAADRPGAGPVSVHRGTAAILADALEDGLKRLLLPSVEREVHAELKEHADRQAVAVFARNLGQLLMTPPLRDTRVLGVDPAYRTGCKLAVLDEHGTHLDHGVVYPTQPQNDYEGAARTVLDLIRKHHVGAVAIGNGTGSRETQTFFARLNTEEGAGIRFTVVSEAGASVYSASAVAQAEYPELDVTVRGAISIAERLQNPMAALVKIDPQSLGIGQYQHDVDQKLLRESLKQTIEALVNRVGVEVNSASPSLLSYVAGVGPKLAARIVADRRANGPFKSKQEVKRVKGMGDHAFQQCAGFLRIRDGQSVLDNTGVHPESYAVADQILRHVDLTAVSDADIAGLVAQVRGDGTSGPGEIGEATVRDIVTELQKPGFDPRSELPEIPFREGITDISELGEGSMVSGVVRSIVDFGAFVDIGIKNDGLVHVSEISEERIGHPMDVLSVNQYLPRIRVIKVDTERGKVGLSLRGV